MVGGIIPLRRATSSRYDGRLEQESADDIPDLLAVGLASLAGAIAAGLSERAVFATIFTFLGAFAISVAITRARDRK
jgi:hypothetical protein